MWVCYWAPGSCYSGRVEASFPVAVAAETPSKRVLVEAASAAARTDAAPPAAYAYTPKQRNALLVSMLLDADETAQRRSSSSNSFH